MKNFRMISLTFAIIMSTFLTVKAQVVTRVLAPDDKIENYIPWYSPSREIPIVKTPFVDVEKVLEQDRITNREMPRIGIKQDVNYTTRNGKLTEYKNYSLWEMTIHSKNSKSMSIRFDNTVLPKEAVMFLYNEKTRFVVGPITNSVFRDGTFRTDYLNGDNINITIFLPNNDKQNDIKSINISSFDYGIIPFRVYDDDFNDSEDCNVNVACEEGEGWGCQINSVCKIIIEESSCSGALINNDCCDLSPYILTANHCFTISGINPTDWNFRFNYESPVCTPSEESYPSQWVTYYGADINARWEDTDFLLLELHNPLNQESSLSFSGWDRTPQMPPNSTYIHHPSGDIKKISFDAGASTIQGGFYRFELTPDINGDFGTLEGGSSGCPKYNSDGRIVGQQHGGTPQRILCNTTDSDNLDGRFDLSWEGNGTNATRLQNWLGASTNPNTMDCMENPYINGPDILCTTPEIYTLINNMPCTKNVTWAVEPTNLFDSPTSGNGTSATLWASSSVSGLATLTFELTSDGCNDAIRTKQIWIGKPVFQLFGDQNLCLCDQGRAFVSMLPILTQNSSISWSITGAVYGTGSGFFANYNSGENSGTGYVTATVTNLCGSYSKYIPVFVSNDNPDCSFSLREIIEPGDGDPCNGDDPPLPFISIYPNPSSSQLYLEIKKHNKEDKNIQILDTNGKVIKSISTIDNSLEIDISNHPEGLYFIKTTIGNKIIHNKFLKL